MTFSEKLTELRKNAGETQDALGEVLGVSGKTITFQDTFLRKCVFFLFIHRMCHQTVNLCFGEFIKFFSLDSTTDFVYTVFTRTGT